DNDALLGSDGPYALTLFLVEKTPMDTGALPDVTYTSPATGGVRGITGNSSAKVLTFTATGANLHDKAYPIVKSVTTGDDDKDGKLDRLVVVFSESMKPLSDGAWRVGFNGGVIPAANTFILDRMLPVATAPGYTATSASQVGDRVTYVLTETASATDPYDTGNKPDFIYTTNNTVMDLALNQLPTFNTPNVTVDGAAPIAYKVGTGDYNELGSASVNPSGSADGFLDGITIFFSETVTAPAYPSGAHTGSFKVLADLSFAATIEN
ncbi:unnamed protein product, partial [marine sediment metagenome]